jgi:hypothetical protein
MTRKSAIVLLCLAVIIVGVSVVFSQRNNSTTQQNSVSSLSQSSTQSLVSTLPTSSDTVKEIQKIIEPDLAQTSPQLPSSAATNDSIPQKYSLSQLENTAWKLAQEEKIQAVVKKAKERKIISEEYFGNPETSEVTDATAVRKITSFYTNTENGDLITQFKELSIPTVVIYRPSSNEIINAGAFIN